MLNGAGAAGPAAGPSAPGAPAPERGPAGFTDLALIGQGSQGHVFRATKSSIGKVVALKAFPLGTSPVHARALGSEVRALVSLSQHPGVVDVHDLHVSGGWAWLEMDYCGGGSARTWAAHLRRSGGGDRTATASALLRVGRQVAEALHFAHERGWVHGDVKPSNILLDDRGSARLCDFGLARLAATGVLSTGSRAAGTPRFQAPEIVGGAVPTAAGDIYALAESLRDLRFALFPDSAVAMAGSWDSDVTDTRELGTSCAEILTDLDVLLTHMSDPDPGLRPRSDEVAERLAALGTRLASGVEGPQQETSAPRRASGARPARLRLAFPRLRRPSAPAAPAATGRPRAGRRVIGAAAAFVLLLLLAISFQLRPSPGADDATGPTVGPTRTPTPSPATGRPSPTPSPTPGTTPPASTSPQPDRPVAPPALPAPGGGETVEPSPNGVPQTSPAASPPTQNPPTENPPTQDPPTVTYRVPAGALSPQYRDGNCIYRIWYGNFGDVPFAKVRFYGGECGGTVITVVAQRGSTTSSYGQTGGSDNTDECGQYLEVQADSRGAAATAVGEDLYFSATGHSYSFRSDQGQPASPYRSC